MTTHIKAIIVFAAATLLSQCSSSGPGGCSNADSGKVVEQHPITINGRSYIQQRILITAAPVYETKLIVIPAR